MDYTYADASTLAKDIRDKRIGCRQILDLYLARLDRINPELNAVVVLDIPRARERADAADAALARGENWGALHGVPMTVKESFGVTGLPTTRGIPELSKRTANNNMLMVERLLSAGAVIFGKSNVPLHLADWQSYNAIYGSTNNPWDLARTPGGSSGGGAAAVAAGLVAIEAGSDSAGSLRVPAHYCGVYGHRPTFGICSQNGHELGSKIAPRDLSTLGPIARSATDLGLMLDVMSGPDRIDANGWTLSLLRNAPKKLPDYRVAVMLDSEISPVDAAIRDQLRKVADFLADQGARVAEARPVLDEEATSRNFVKLLRAAGSSGMSAAAFEVASTLVRQAPADERSYRTEVARAETMSHREWLDVDEARHRIRGTWASFFDEWDVLICPVSSTPAVAHDHVSQRWQQTIEVDGRCLPATDQMFWVGFSAQAYLPSTVAPVGLSAEGLPVGIQIIGPQYSDYVCIDFASKLERAYRGFTPPPRYA